MKKLLALTVFSFAFVVQSMAQSMKVVDFKLLENDLTANTRGTEKMDQNGERAALIKIQTPERGFTFDGGSLGIVANEEHAGEIWLYVPRRAQKLIIQHPEFGVLRDWYYPISIKGARTYELILDIGTGRYANLTSSVAESNIYVDGVNIGKSPIYNKYLNFGKHKVEAKKDRYEGEIEFYITTDDDAKEVRMINVEQRVRPTSSSRERMWVTDCGRHNCVKEPMSWRLRRQTATLKRLHLQLSPSARIM